MKIYIFLPNASDEVSQVGQAPGLGGKGQRRKKDTLSLDDSVRWNKQTGDKTLKQHW